MTSRDTSALSRRSALRVGAAVGFGLSTPSLARATDRTASATGSEATEVTEVTVATWNLGLGANLFTLFLVESEADLARTVGDLYDDIRQSAPTARMGAVARELARTRPDVVGLQEAAVVGTESPGDDGVGAPDAETVAFDFLADLTDALDDAGESYEVAQVTTNADAEFPALVDGDRIDVRLTDRDVVLVRADADVRATDGSETTFEAGLTVPVGDDRTFRVERGYGTVAATAGGREFTVVNTHLESASRRVRSAQAAELAAELGGGETILLGDLNDGPAHVGGAYETLAADLTDGWAAARPDDDGSTCCRATTMDGPGSMDERVDHVLASSGFEATDARVVGADPGGRVTVTVDGESRTVWPSDHAGVVSTLRVGASSDATAGDATPEETPTTERSPTATPADEDATTGGANETGVDDADPGAGGGEPTASNVSGGNDSAPGESETAPDESETATGSPGFGLLAGAVGTLGGAAELLRRRH